MSFFLKKEKEKEKKKDPHAFSFLNMHFSSFASLFINYQT